MKIFYKTFYRVLALFAVLFAAVNANAQCSAVCYTYTSVGSTNWTCPAGVTSVTVQCWGAGGGGGGVNATSTQSAGGGGAGGSFAQGVGITVTPGNTYAIVVGAGGSSNIGLAGGTGGSSSFGGASVIAVGGAGGSAGINGNGAASTGSTTGNAGTGFHAGGNGSAGSNSSYHGGGGGGGAGTTTNGGNATATSTAGTGGATGGSAGGNGSSTTGNNPGSAGTDPGGAGGGASTTVVGTNAGGIGGDGQVVLCYLPPTCTGTPVAGTATASDTAFACSGGYSNLGLTGTSVACGLTYQWQSSTNNSTWSNIGGATSSAFTATVNTSTYYHCVVTCTTTPSSATSTSIYVASTATTACYTCFDGIQNGTETGVDCGGTCALTCSTNSATVSSSCSCPAASSATIYSTTCAQVGTSAYDLNSPVVDFASCAATPPSALTCTAAAVTSTGSWIHLTLGAGVTQVQLSLTTGAMAAGSSAVYGAIYQGPSCAALTQVGGCQKLESFISSVYAAYSVLFTGLTPGQDVWIYLYDDSNKGFNLNYQAVGTPSAPTNTTCASASTATGNGCNLGAPGSSFTPPSAAGATPACTGGNWGSNENTVYFSFTPTATTASLSINSIICDDGTTGTAQFAVWTSCAAIGTYTSTSTYLGCAVGTGTISLSGLTVGQTYYIAADGTAGSNCKWDFAATNIIILPVEMINFNAKFTGMVVNLDWATASEINNAYFTVEKSLDAINFQSIATVKGAGNSEQLKSYTSIDKKPGGETIYYRIKQTDFNGRSSYSPIKIVRIKESDITFGVKPNPSTTFCDVSYNCHSDESITLKIVDISGKSVYDNIIACTQGLNTTTIDMSSQAKGMYFVILTAGDKVYKSILIKSE